MGGLSCIFIEFILYEENVFFPIVFFFFLSLLVFSLYINFFFFLFFLSFSEMVCLAGFQTSCQNSTLRIKQKAAQHRSLCIYVKLFSAVLGGCSASGR